MKSQKSKVMEADGTENRSDLSLDGLLGEADKFHLQYPDFSVGSKNCLFQFKVSLQCFLLRYS